MLASNIPSKIQLPFASSGTKNTIPVPSQIGITPGAASYTDGFPPLTFTALTAGGIPPDGADVNGVLNAITAIQQWQSAGGHFKYDSAFSTAIGGYPAGAILNSSDGLSQWLNLADNNTTDPDGATPANWAALSAYGITTVSGLTNANVTLTATQYKNRIIVLTGTLTGNIQIIFPTLSQQWRIINNTTGNFSVTCKTAAGTGAIAAQILDVHGDGTNLIPMIGFGNYGTIASAATLDVSGVYADAAHVSGTTTITAITMRNGQKLTMTFDGVLTLTNGASLILPGGVNITTSAGDVAVFIGESGGVVRCVAYSSRMALGTTVATTSGTAIDFTGIPGWVKRITVNLNGVSTNSTAGLLIQIGSGAVETTGYNGFTSFFGVASISSTAGIPVFTNIATNTITGSIVFTYMGGNLWIASGTITDYPNSANNGIVTGNKLASGVIDRLRLTTVTGTPLFDAGSVNIMYEG